MTTIASPIQIACAADHRYALPTAVMLRSLADHLPDKRTAVVHLLDDGMSPDHRDRIRASLPASVDIRFLPSTQAPIAGLPLWGRMSPTTYQKLALGDWVPASVGQVLWLDSDLLVLSDVSRLWDSGPGEHLLLAHQDPRVPFVSSRFGITSYRELGLDAHAPYFNAGVLLINLARWRATNVLGRSVDYLRSHHRQVYFWDQEALNAVLAGQWGSFDARWNWHTVLSTLNPDAADAPFVVHFSGNLKPWHYTGASEYYRAYYRVLDRTAWSGWRPAASFTAAVTARYESSALRRLLYPAEQWATWAVRELTRRYHHD